MNDVFTQILSDFWVESAKLLSIASPFLMISAAVAAVGLLLGIVISAVRSSSKKTDDDDDVEWHQY